MAQGGEHGGKAVLSPAAWDKLHLNPVVRYIVIIRCVLGLRALFILPLISRVRMAKKNPVKIRQNMASNILITETYYCQCGFFFTYIICLFYSSLFVNYFAPIENLSLFIYI